MKKSIYRSTLLIVLFSLLVFIGGCTLIPKSVRKDLIVDYLNDKYTDDHFEFVDYFGGKPWSNDSVTVLCTSEKYPSKIVKASYVTKKNKYYDNYAGIEFAEQLDEYVNGVARELFPGHRIKCASYLDEIENRKLIDLPANSSFDDYLKTCKEAIYIYCEYDSSELDKDKEIIEERLKKIISDMDMNVNTILIRFTNNVDADLRTLNSNTYMRLVVGFNQGGFNTIEEIKWE